MLHRHICLVFGGLFSFLACSSADIVWSGDMYLRAYHEIPNIDFDQDGENDFIYMNEMLDTGYEAIWIKPTDGQTVVLNDSGFLYQTAVALESGVSVSSDMNAPDKTWAHGKSFLFVYGTAMGSPNPGGPFGDGNAYLGVAFSVNESTHYGWIQMSHDIGRTSPDYEYLYVNGWAWETEADTPIVTGAIPEPSSGALVIVGALSLWQLRRTRQRKGIDFNTRMPKDSIKSASSKNPAMW